MRKQVVVAILGVGLTLLPTVGRAQAFRGLGFFDPGVSNHYSRALDVSADGTTVVGESNGQAFRWTTSAPTILEPLGLLEVGSKSEAHAVSADGTVVVGSGGLTGFTRAFRWTAVTGMLPLGVVVGGAESNSAEGISSDGSVVVGGSTEGPGGFRWTQGGGMVAFQSLPYLNKGNHATAVSGDGQVAVGRGGCCEGGGVVSVRWPGGATTPESLGDLPGTAPESPWGAAAGVSGDGLVVVGGGGGPMRAYRWSGGMMVELAPSTFPPGDGSGLDASGIGDVIVGAASDPPGETVSAPVGPVAGGRAFVWTQADGMRSVEDVLTGLGLGSLLTNWRLEAATGISDDGNILVGYGLHNGVREGWVAALTGTPFPSSPPDDDDDDDPPYGTFRVTPFFAALRESHGFLWGRGRKPVPILPDPPPFLDPAALHAVRWVEGATGPRGVEQIWAVRSENAEGAAQLDVLGHAGRGWTLDWTSRGPGAALLGTRGFAVAHEEHSGDALVVYESGAGTPRYRTRRGGAWSEERVLPVEAARREVAALDEGIVRWIELAARPGTDEIALVYAGEHGHLLAWTWNGDSWSADSAALLSDHVEMRAGAGRPFDVAFEGLSGALVVAWSRAGGRGAAFARRRAGVATWEQPAGAELPEGEVALVDLAAEPTSDLVAGALMGRFSGRRAVILSIWDSKRWRHSSPRDAGAPSSRVPAPFPGALAWVGTSRVALFAFAGARPGTIDWVRWTQPSGWSEPRAADVSGLSPVASIRLASALDGATMALISDEASRLHAVSYEGSWHALTPRPIADPLDTAGALPYGLGVARDAVLLVGDPAPGRSPAAGNGHLLSFTLVPRAAATRVEALAFDLHGLLPSDRPLLADAVVAIDGDSRTEVTVGGPAGVNPAGRLVFSEPFEVTRPTRFVLRSRHAAASEGRLSASLSQDGVAAASVVVRGDAGRSRARR